MSIEEAVLKGMKEEAGHLARAMLETMEPMTLVSEHLIPALDEVGARYERGQIFLPQLMNAAAASGAAFEEVRRAMPPAQESDEGGPILLATVEGDIHDIGKNIVRAVLENTGYRVVDLGRDVKAGRVAEEARRRGARIVGLSALMTTTVPGMERTIRLLHEAGVRAPVIVGGAVLTEEYAREIGADYYAKDAKRSADIVRSILG